MSNLAIQQFEGDVYIKASSQPSLYGTGSLQLEGTLLTPSLTISSSTASTSSITGALLLVGGIGINNTTDAISSTNGGTFTTAGGLSVAKKCFIGTNCSIGGTLVVSGTSTLNSSTIIDVTSTTAFTIRKAGATGDVLIVNTSSSSVKVNSSNLEISGAISGTPNTTGKYLTIPSSTFTDNNTSASGTATNMVFNSFGQPTLAATNSSVTTTNASTVYIAGAPIAGTNETITNSYALNVASGNVYFGGNLTVVGTIIGSLLSSFVAIIVDSKTSGTDGGSSTAGSWITRTLNTVNTNTISGLSLSSNQVTVPSGTYIMYVSAPGSNCDSHKIRLFNVTNTTTDALGTSEYAGDAASQSFSYLYYYVTLGSPTTYRIDHYTTVSRATTGFGVSTAIPSINEIYTVFYILRLT